MKDLARNAILALEEQMKGMNGYDPAGAILCEITHRFAPGVYAREMWMPKDCLITGKIHKTEHICILSQGSVRVSSGGDYKDMAAPYTFIAPVGTKRAIYAFEDAIWTTIHPNPKGLKDPDEIEKDLIAESFEEIDMLEHKGNL